MAESDPGVEAWVEHTSAFDRVRSVAGALSEPRPASLIAAEAAVSENTARGHLDRLVELNVLVEVGGEGATRYAPDPLHARLATLRELVAEHDHDGLVALKADLQTEIEEWRAAYGVDSPTELRERAAEADSAAETTEIRRTASDWELVTYRLGIVDDAIENYAAYTRDGTAPA